MAENETTPAAATPTRRRKATANAKGRKGVADNFGDFKIQVAEELAERLGGGKLAETAVNAARFAVGLSAFYDMRKVTANAPAKCARVILDALAAERLNNVTDAVSDPATEADFEARRTRFRQAAHD